jgi:hypothetical protein
MILVLHENKGNEHARGHLGTELQNKAGAVLRVSNSKCRTHHVLEYRDGRYPYIPAMKVERSGPNGTLCTLQELDQHTKAPTTKKGLIADYTDEELHIAISPLFSDLIELENGVLKAGIKRQLPELTEAGIRSAFADLLSREILNHNGENPRGARSRYSLNAEFKMKYKGSL